MSYLMDLWILSTFLYALLLWKVEAHKACNFTNLQAIWSICLFGSDLDLSFEDIHGILDIFDLI